MKVEFEIEFTRLHILHRYKHTHAEYLHIYEDVHVYACDASVVGCLRFFLNPLQRSK